LKGDHLHALVVFSLVMFLGFEQGI